MPIFDGSKRNGFSFCFTTKKNTWCTEHPQQLPFIRRYPQIRARFNPLHILATGHRYFMFRHISHSIPLASGLSSECRKFDFENVRLKEELLNNSHY